MRQEECISYQSGNDSAGDNAGHDNRVLRLVDNVVGETEQRLDGSEREACGH